MVQSSSALLLSIAALSASYAYPIEQGNIQSTNVERRDSISFRIPIPSLLGGAPVTPAPASSPPTAKSAKVLAKVSPPSGGVPPADPAATATDVSALASPTASPISPADAPDAPPTLPASLASGVAARSFDEATEDILSRDNLWDSMENLD